MLSWSCSILICQSLSLKVEMQYEVLFYGGVRSEGRNLVVYLGSMTNRVNDLEELKSNAFVNFMTDHFYSILFTSQLRFSDHNASCCVMYDTTSCVNGPNLTGPTTIYFCMSSFKPVPMVTRIVSYDPAVGAPPLLVQQHGKLVELPHHRGITMKGYFFELNLEAVMYNDTSKLFLVLLNAMMKRCTPEDHARPLQRNSYIRFLFHSDDPSLPPYAYGYHCSFDEGNVELLKTCPPDLLPCEFNGLHVGRFFFVSRQEWIAKRHLQVVDIQQLD